MTIRGVLIAPVALALIVSSCGGDDSQSTFVVGDELTEWVSVDEMHEVLSEVSVEVHGAPLPEMCDPLVVNSGDLDDAPEAERIITFWYGCDGDVLPTEEERAVSAMLAVSSFTWDFWEPPRGDAAFSTHPDLPGIEWTGPPEGPGGSVGFRRESTDDFLAVMVSIDVFSPEQPEDHEYGLPIMDPSLNDWALSRVGSMVLREMGWTE